MDKMWAGRFEKNIDREADDFNSSIHIDSRMYKQDIKGSIQHAYMLAAQNIISVSDGDKIVAGLTSILDDIENGKLDIDMSCEDIHMFVESELTKRIGDSGKKLHTARSRNDQVALDIRLYLRDVSAEIDSGLQNLIKVICNLADKNIDAVMPGYTHLQRAQPILFSHHILSYAMMFMRDRERLTDTVKRMNYSPLGSCALAGTTYNTDRKRVAEALGFSGITMNSIDGVSDRDFCVELCSAISLIMMHLSRFSEEIILWSSWEFKFIELDDSFTTGSSIMPQKKNPDIAELVRGKTGRVYGDLIALLTVLKGLPLAYNKDMQEDKEAVFDAVDTVKKCLSVFAGMAETITVNRENMRNAASKGFINATDLADYLVRKGLPFRTAYKIVGEIVAFCIREGCTLDTLPLTEYIKFSDKFDNDLYDSILLENCVNTRISEGGTSKNNVLKQIDFIRNTL